MQGSNIGVIIPDVGNSEMTFYTVSQCHVAKQTTKYEPFIFVEDFQPPCMQIMVSCMNLSEVFSFTGTLIATNLKNAAIMAKANTNALKVFYVWDLEFLRRGNNNFEANNQIYRNKDIKIVCRSEEHAKVFANYTNRQPDLIVPCINIVEIHEKLQNKRS